MGQEIRQPSGHIDDASVMVIGHRSGENNLDAVLLGRDGEAVNESIVGLVVWTEEEPPFRTTPRDHVRSAWHDGARKRHVSSSARHAARLSKINR
jgi:hypothetical protein